MTSARFLAKALAWPLFWVLVWACTPTQRAVIQDVTEDIDRICGDAGSPADCAKGLAPRSLGDAGQDSQADSPVD